jgi:ABC-2 type transport system permease protein
MNKILLIAQREFLTTVANKGFIFGLFLMPVLIGVAVLIGPRLVGTMRSPQVVGRVAVVDPTGQVLPVLRSTLSPAAIQERRQAEAMRALAAVSGGEGIPSSPAATAFAPAPDLAIVERPSSADLESEKKALSAADQAARVMALVVVAADAVEQPAAGAEFGTYSIYASRDLNADTERILYESLREAIVTARLTASQLDQQRIDTMTRVRRPVSVTVTQAGEQRSRRQFMQMLPFLVGVMLFAAVIMGGQQLMTSTVEEKSSRVVEVLLAAVSPFQLMFGKLLGQAAVGLLGIAIYLALGLLALYSFAMFGIIDPLLIVYFLVFFLITYLVFGALMMSIGAAVNTMQEAGSLMGPVMLMLLFPYMLSPMIGRAPNSPLSVAMSFIPPFNSFAMMTRMSSESPPPSWQIWLTLLIGIGTVFVAIWFAAKIFKVGLLMHGKPPNVATLIRWARQA